MSNKKTATLNTASLKPPAFNSVALNSTLKEKFLISIKGTGLFKGLSEGALENLVRNARLKKFPSDKMIFQQGSPAEFFFIVLEGKIKVCRFLPDGREFILNIFSSGAPVGVLPVFKREPYPANAISIEKSVILVINRTDLLACIQDNQEVLLESIQVLGDRLKQFVNRVEDLSTKQVASRLAIYILNLNKGQNCNPVRIEIKKGDLAIQIGTISETLSRALKQMQKKNLIQVSGRMVKILDGPKLKILSDGEKL